MSCPVFPADQCGWPLWPINLIGRSSLLASKSFFTYCTTCSIPWPVSVPVGGSGSPVPTASRSSKNGSITWLFHADGLNGETDMIDKPFQVSFTDFRRVFDPQKYRRRHFWDWPVVGCLLRQFSLYARKWFYSSALHPHFNLLNSIIAEWRGGELTWSAWYWRWYRRR